MKMLSDGKGGYGYALNRSEAAKRREADKRYARHEEACRVEWMADEPVRQAEVEAMERAYAEAMAGTL